jgi:SAM-dependent methyltransferase
VCNKRCLDFGRRAIEKSDVSGKRIIEIGSRDVNGSFRQIVESFEPAEYIGVDIEAGPGVDTVCSVHDLTARFGKESFDMVISTEMIEHVRDWKRAISQIKSILRPEGFLILTTRSKGFPYHDYPSDYWRFEIEDMTRIFSDMSGQMIEPDDSEPGVFVKAKKPATFIENDLRDHALYSMITDRKSADVSPLDVAIFRLKKLFRRLYPEKG